MFRARYVAAAVSSGFPHSRGDVPRLGATISGTLPFSPLTWGCSLALAARRRRSYVFPTHVGMFRAFWRPSAPWAGFPHSRGDVPGLTFYRRLLPRVFPTHVGMFRTTGRDMPSPPSFPHSRGDVPSRRRNPVPGSTFSPLTWGCSDGEIIWEKEPSVFPTHVGMFRSMEQSGIRRLRFPHSRGDVPSMMCII